MSLATLQRDLDTLRSQGRFRQLIPRAGFDFSSNDYLGLAGSPELLTAAREALSRGVPLGSGGSRLLRGNHIEHEALEDEAAAFFGSEAALYFSSGFAANATLLSTLPQRGDQIFYDEFVHASCHDGIRLSRADAVRARHNDPQAFDDAVKQWRSAGGIGCPWIVAESLYSMDGDRAPLEDLLDVVRRHDGMFIVDEAHSTGVFGAGGRGLAAGLGGHDDVITVRTCGKALGSEGALVCGSPTVRSFLVNRGRGFIFSTAPSPFMAAMVRASLRIIGDGVRQKKHKALLAYAEQRLASVGAAVSGSQIIPLVVGDDRETMRRARALQDLGFDVRGIRPPTVPEGTSRLRISVTLNVDEQAIASLCAALAEIQP